MHFQRKRRAFLALAFCAFLAAAPAGPIPPPGRVRVLATVFPLADFARTILGDRGSVELILPLGADVHTWQPRISDVRRLETADILVYVGRGLEPWLDALLHGASVPKLVRYEAAAELPLLPAEADERDNDHDHGAFDPHVWLDFDNDLAIVDGMVKTLAAADPAGAPEFERRAAVLKADLRALDAAFARALKDCRGREFILGGHAAFAYLARRYGLRQVALFGTSPDAAPTSRRTAAIIARAKRDGVRTIFYEPATGEKMARIIASEIGADVVALYPGHNLSPGQAAAGMTFLKLMAANLESFKHGLGCR